MHRKAFYGQNNIWFLNDHYCYNIVIFKSESTMSLTFIWGLITGLLITTLGQYCAQKLTDYRRRSEKTKNKKLDLDKLFNEYPDFMTTLKNNINDPEYINVREFFVVDKNALLNSSLVRFRYELSEAIYPVLKRLEELGCIEKLENNCLLYRIKEDFYIQLKSYKQAILHTSPEEII